MSKFPKSFGFPWTLEQLRQNVNVEFNTVNAARERQSWVSICGYNCAFLR